MTAIDLIRWLGETSLAVGALIFLILIIRKPVAKAFGANAAYALWLAPALRLFLPELKILPQPAAEPPVATAMLETTVFDAGLAGAATAPALPPFDFASLGAAAGLFIWITVAVAWFSLKLESQTKFLRARMAQSDAAPIAISDTANELARQFGLKRTPSVWISHDDTGPCVVGLFRPVVFLPLSFETSYSARERYLALAHEIAHIARGDMAATLIAIGFQAAQWPNPLAHAAFAKFRTDQEAACDAFVMARCRASHGAAGEYASAIMKSIRNGATTPAYGLSLAHPVKERIMLLKNQKKSRLRLAAGAVSVAAITAASLAGTASYGFAPDKDQDSTRVMEREVKSVQVVSVDGDEQLVIDGVEGAAKLEIVKEDGVSTVKVYDADGNVISENVYAGGEPIALGKVVIVGKDGDERNVVVKALGDHDLEGLALVHRLGGDKQIVMLNTDPHGAEMEKRAVFVGDMKGDAGANMVFMPHDGEQFFEMSQCSSGEDGAGAMVLEWTDEEAGDEHRFVTKEVICLSGDDADPEMRAEMLRKAIASMEDSAKREAEQRKKIIKELREELKKAEKEAR